MTDLPDFVPPDNVKLFYKTGATFDQNVICDYLTQIIQPYAIDNSLEPILFIDSAKCHLTKQVDLKFKDIHVGKYIIQPRFTICFSQPTSLGSKQLKAPTQEHGITGM